MISLLTAFISRSIGRSVIGSGGTDNGGCSSAPSLEEESKVDFISTRETGDSTDIGLSGSPGIGDGATKGEPPDINGVSVLLTVAGRICWSTN